MVSPDDSAAFESVTEDMKLQRDTAQDIVAALRHRTSEGKIFEVLRPLAHRMSSVPRAFGEHARIATPLRTVFANMAINRVVNAFGSELLAWFEQIAECTH